MSHPLPLVIQKCLQSLQRRMLAVRVFRGTGLLLLSFCVIVALSFCLDYFLRPPLVVRILHASFVVLFSLYLLKRWLLTPLRHRPTAVQLAAIIEKSHRFDDRLSSSVELCAQHDMSEGSFLESLVDQAVDDCEQLQPQHIFPLSSPLIKFSCALLSCSALALCAYYFPQHNSIFWQRMTGSNITWPAQTKLIFVVDNLSSKNNFLTSTGPNHLVLHTSDPGSLSLQARALGKLPSRVVLHGLTQSHGMTPLGGGDFKYDLPPLSSTTTFSLSGGDHQQASSSLEVIIGDAPMLSNWAVTVTAPPYTLLPPEDSSSQELRVIEGSLIEFSFAVDGNDVEVNVVDANNNTLLMVHDVLYSGSIIATESNELTITIKNQDGFTSYYPNQLSWQYYTDLAPQIEVIYPQRNFYAVDGGVLPLSIQLSDDFSLSELQLLDQDQQLLTKEIIDGLRAKRFLSLDATLSSEDISSISSQHFNLSVSDNRSPIANQSALQTANYYVQSAEEAEAHLLQEVQSLRRRLDNLRDQLDVFAQVDEKVSSFEVRRVVDSIEAALEQSEWLLCERVFSKIDANPAELLAVLRALLGSNFESGAVVNVFAQQNAGVLAGRSHNLWQLANALLIARDYPARDLVTAFENKEDLRQPFSRLREEIDVILETIVSWEDYQSAVNLLRQLLDRQRGLYLRTQEAVL
ncbi:MAG: hypothetical protein P8L98_00530 [Planctomycetota bacterium]|nr:hypothetical protein [Planctomycetota bacterium]